MLVPSFFLIELCNGADSMLLKEHRVEILIPIHFFYHFFLSIFLNFLSYFRADPFSDLLFCEYRCMKITLSAVMVIKISQHSFFFQFFCGIGMLWMQSLSKSIDVAYILCDDRTNSKNLLSKCLDVLHSSCSNLDGLGSKNSLSKYFSTMQTSCDENPRSESLLL